MRRGTPGVADAMVRHFGYGHALAFVRQLRRAGFSRGPRLPAERTLRRAEIRRLSPTCDVDATAARLGLSPTDLRRRLRRRHRNTTD